jgi:hypothetical protein
VRIWDLEPAALCDRHLLGEHRELHGIWSILVNGKQGYSRHPETLRWQGRLAALFARHEALVIEMDRRGFRHRSPLEPAHATGKRSQEVFVDSIARQRELLAQKGCGCRV